MAHVKAMMLAVLIAAGCGGGGTKPATTPAGSGSGDGSAAAAPAEPIDCNKVADHLVEVYSSDPTFTPEQQAGIPQQRADTVKKCEAADLATDRPFYDCLLKAQTADESKKCADLPL